MISFLLLFGVFALVLVFLTWLFFGADNLNILKQFQDYQQRQVQKAQIKYAQIQEERKQRATEAVKAAEQAQAARNLIRRQQKDAFLFQQYSALNLMDQELAAIEGVEFVSQYVDELTRFSTHTRDSVHVLQANKSTSAAQRHANSIRTHYGNELENYYTPEQHKQSIGRVQPYSAKDIDVMDYDDDKNRRNYYEIMDAVERINYLDNPTRTDGWRKGTASNGQLINYA